MKNCAICQKPKKQCTCKAIKASKRRFSKNQAILELMQAIGARETVTAIMNVAAQSFPLRDDQQRFRTEANIEGLVSHVACVYEKHFNEAEIRILLKFYKSAPGQKVIVDTPKIYQECKAVGSAWATSEAHRLGIQIKTEPKLTPMEIMEKAIPFEEGRPEEPAPAGLTEKEIKELKELKSGETGKKIIELMEVLDLTDEELLVKLRMVEDEEKHKKEDGRPTPLKPPLYKKAYLKGGIDGHALDAAIHAVKTSEPAKEPTCKLCGQKLVHKDGCEYWCVYCGCTYDAFWKKEGKPPCATCGRPVETYQHTKEYFDSRPALGEPRCVNCGETVFDGRVIAPGQLMCNDCWEKRGNEDKKKEPKTLRGRTHVCKIEDLKKAKKGKKE